ncbi:uncharacterized protein N0V89_002409 [Didymosphaeria variabile]|uniref:CPAF-like PDZ domain-containing protein n=1 Tax=Didymosphaeria variabile TaxID=1932322 RepID=A0A9W9CEM5_9PLEO|nr:uncharacterized protein N0V89_002409 [Didymosphaeria variabile]KAJ4357833.1 hypothetical protein N0V89_002409 [Didymosphaeria variabile]
MSLDVEGDKRLIDELKIAWQWHYDITWLKNPPADRENGSLDLITELDQIKINLEIFESESQVQVAIKKITVRSGDYHLNYMETSPRTKISDVAKINDNDAWQYLENLAQWEQYRDTDGRINSLWAKGDTLTPGAFMVQSRFDGAETNITFANGTTIELINTAWTNEDFTDVKEGKPFHEKFCQGDIFGARAGDND